VPALPKVLVAQFGAAAVLGAAILLLASLAILLLTWILLPARAGWAITTAVAGFKAR